MAASYRHSPGFDERPHRGRAASYAPASPTAFDMGFSSRRSAVVMLLFLAIAAVFVVKLAGIQLVDGPADAQEARAIRMLDQVITPKRGTIYDRNGRVLAASVEAKTIYCDPEEVEDAAAAAQAVAEVMGGKAEDYAPAFEKTGYRFAFLVKKADPEKADELKAREIAGIHFLADTKRVYPNGSVGGQLIGVLGDDGEGKSGLEAQYDDILGGEQGSLKYEQGARGEIIVGTDESTKPVPGRDITVSIDIDLQQKVEGAVASMTDEMKAKYGQALVLDGASGEILACASTPYLDPADIQVIEDRAMEAQCITRAFEPGSIFKTVAMLAALEDGSVSPMDTFYCPAYLPADEYFVSDAHERDNETMTATDILVRSSNVGISLITKRMGFEKLNDAIDAYGLAGTFTGVDFPGESAGYLLDFSQWSRIQGYNVSFGQGVSVTPLQMARFYGAIANGGQAYVPHFLLSKDGQEASWKSTRIVEDGPALAQVVDMLQQVVERGTGTGAQINGFSVAGKTGTAEYVDEEHREDGYVKDHYNNSFVGFLPGTDSKLVCFVGANEVPSETATTEVFQDIMSFAIERYNINPIQE